MNKKNPLQQAQATGWIVEHCPLPEHLGGKLTLTRLDISIWQEKDADGNEFWMAATWGLRPERDTYGWMNHREYSTLEEALEAESNSKTTGA